MWPLRLALAKLRPWNAASIARVSVVALLVLAFLIGDYAMFRRIFGAMKNVEKETPLFALGLLRNLLSMVYLVATVILLSSSMTVAIGSFFTDLDLDLYHARPRSRLRIALSRYMKTLVQSAAMVFLFLVPMILAFAHQYPKTFGFYPMMFGNLALLLSIPVSLASTLILLLVRWFPVQRVHQIVATLAMIVLTLAVLALRMSRPERFFAQITTDDVRRVLSTIELPSMSLYPSTSLATMMTKDAPPIVAPRVAITSGLLFLIFVVVARASYFVAFVRARESLAPVAIGSAAATRFLDRLVTGSDPPLRAMFGKEVRTLTRDAAQWSQVFLMAALLFMYLYNIRMLPLGGDARATLVAYLNLGMAGFVIAAICLRFAYPSVSAEGKAFWIVQTAPVSYRRFLIVKVLVYATPLTALSLLLTAFANALLDANAVVWTFTLLGASLLAITLVSLGIGLGAMTPNFNAENPLQVGLSIGGFAYMAISMMYVGTMMVLMARPLMRYFTGRVLGLRGGSAWLGIALPIVIALTLSLLLSVIPMRLAEQRLSRTAESD
jgi:ABC-2 type transport system permease protein